MASTDAFTSSPTENQPLCGPRRPSAVNLKQPLGPTGKGRRRHHPSLPTHDYVRSAISLHLSSHLFSALRPRYDRRMRAPIKTQYVAWMVLLFHASCTASHPVCDEPMDAAR